MIYFIAYYLASLITTIYVDKKKEIKFEAKLDGKKVNKLWTLVLCSPLLPPVMLLYWIAEKKK